jgi:hypothetical protein
VNRCDLSVGLSRKYLDACQDKNLKKKEKIYYYARESRLSGEFVLESDIFKKNSVKLEFFVFLNLKIKKKLDPTREIYFW